MTDTPVDVTIVGAGLSGIAAAAELRRRGRSIRVLDKSRGLGGRMASRRSGEARFDHGAQFFTTRSQDFAAVVEAAVEDGAVEAWTHGFDDPPDGYPRYRGVPAMTALTKWLAASHGVEVETGTTVVDLGTVPARAHLLTAPVPQSLAVLSFSGLLPPPDLHQQLAQIAYKPTIAVLLELAGTPQGFPDHGGVQYLDHPTLAFVTDNQRKGVSGQPAVTIHLTNEVSAARWADSDDALVALAVDSATAHLTGAQVTSSQVMRWRYAGPVEVWPDRTASWGTDPMVCLAGEAFGGPKVEGAYLSGVAAATAIDTALD